MQQAQRVLKVLLAQQVQPVLKVQRVLKALQVQQAQPVLKVHKVHKAQPEQMVLMVLMAKVSSSGSLRTSVMFNVMATSTNSTFRLG